jgi:hypothetical protein
MLLREIASVEELECETADPSLKRLYGYWTERRGARPYPSRHDIDPLDFAYALGRVSLIDVLERPRRFRYRLVSTTLTERLGYEMTGKFLDEVPEAEMRDYSERFYVAALERRAPLYFRDDTMLDGRRWRHEGLALPLSADGLRVDMLMIYREAEAPVPPDPVSTPVPDLEFLDQVDEPLLAELVAYWDAKRAGRMAPRRSDIDPAELKPHLTGLLMLDVLDGGADFRYRLIGTAIVQGSGRDSTGRRMSELYADQPAVLQRLLDRFRRVVTEQRPIYTRGRIYWVPNREYRRFVTVAVPLSDDGRTVNIILSEMILSKG